MRGFFALHGGKGSHGISLRELAKMVEKAQRQGLDLDKTRVCSHPDRDKGLVDLYLIEGE